MARSNPAMRSLIADKSGGGEDWAGADLTSFTAAASFSDCARTAASSPRNAAWDFSSASMRAAAPASGAAGGLLVFDSTLAIRATRSSMTAALTWGAVGVAGTAGHPRIQPTPITSAAATAPETGAITHGEIGAEGSREMRSGSGSDCGSGRASAPALRVSLEISDASRSMVGGARLARPESGDGAGSSGLSSAIATVPYLFDNDDNRSRRHTQTIPVIP